MNPASRRRGPTAVLMLAGVMVFGCTGLVDSQTFDCDGVRRRIAALDRGDRGQASRQASRYVRSARRQQREIDRTVAYRRSLGCDRLRFSLFGGGGPPDCARIDAQIDRMNANLAVLQQSAARMADGDPDERNERNELMQRYEVYCRQPADFAALEPRPFPDRRYAPDDVAPPGTGFRRMPLDPDNGDADAPEGRRDDAAPAEPDAGDSGETIGGSKAVCVKTCDGSFFPVSYSASHGNLGSLEALCHASCPNAETKLYTYDIATEIDQAVDKEGKSYAELPNANRFSKMHDPSCSCRAPGKTWLETLAEAERVYAGGKHDIVVTQQMSDALARAAPVAATKVKPRSRRAGSRQSPNPTSENVRPEPAAAASDATTSAQVGTPAARTGLDDGAASLRGTGEPSPREPNAAEVSKRRVRVIAPNL